MLQVVHYTCNHNFILYDILDCVRCPGLLANSCNVFLCLVRVNHEKAVTVSESVSCSDPRSTVPLRHMIKYRYVPFDWGRKTRYGASNK